MRGVRCIRIGYPCSKYHSRLLQRESERRVRYVCNARICTAQLSDFKNNMYTMETYTTWELICTKDPIMIPPNRLPPLSLSYPKSEVCNCTIQAMMAGRQEEVPPHFRHVAFVHASKAVVQASFKTFAPNSAVAYLRRHLVHGQMSHMARDGYVNKHTHHWIMPLGII